MTQQPNKYGKLTADDLRVMLGFIDLLQQEEAETNALAATKRAKIFPVGGQGLTWCHLYELPAIEMYARIILAIGMQDSLKEIASSENQIQAMAEQIRAIDDMDIDAPEGEDLLAVISLVQPIMSSLRCMMVYGCSVNDLIRTAREGKSRDWDQALLRAIRIDPTVIGCQTAVARMSYAVMQRDEKFVGKVSRALSGKLGTREQRNYQQMRLVLQALHDSGANRLNDEQLKALFVEELKLYSPTVSAEKNLKEFAYNFNKQKSTI